jgi:hypothetical protein
MRCIPFLVLALVACGSTGPTPVAEQSPRTMSARINGQPWAASGSQVEARLRVDTLTLIGKVAGRDLERSTEIWIVITAVDGPGSYDISVFNKNGFAAIVHEFGFNREIITNDLSSVAQAINITELDARHVKGTFYFTAERRASTGVPAATYIVNDGSFDVEL